SGRRRPDEDVVHASTGQVPRAARRTPGPAGAGTGMGGRMTLPLKLYRIGTSLLEPAAAALLVSRRRKGKEDPERIGERRGIPGLPRPAGRLAWVHGASVGEVV